MWVALYIDMEMYAKSYLLFQETVYETVYIKSIYPEKVGKEMKSSSDASRKCGNGKACIHIFQVVLAVGIPGNKIIVAECRINHTIN